jgi:hypothetical protein
VNLVQSPDLSRLQSSFSPFLGFNAVVEETSKFFLSSNECRLHAVLSAHPEACPPPLCAVLLHELRRVDAPLADDGLLALPALRLMVGAILGSGVNSGTSRSVDTGREEGQGSGGGGRDGVPPVENATSASCLGPPPASAPTTTLLGPSSAAQRSCSPPRSVGSTGTYATRHKKNANSGSAERTRRIMKIDGDAIVTLHPAFSVCEAETTGRQQYRPKSGQTRCLPPCKGARSEEYF